LRYSTLGDLAPRIKELKARQDELNKARVQLEADMVVEGVELLDAKAVKSYAHDLKNLLDDADITQRKSFIKSFVKRIMVDGEKIIVSYKLPAREGVSMESAVLPIERLGGAGGARTLYLLTASQTLYQVSYSPIFNC
jgi:site-specific DNA recombinase